MSREVSEEDRKFLKQKLLALKYQMSVEFYSVLQFELIYGLTDKVIDGVVETCHLIFNPDDLMKLCQIWSYASAVIVCNIVNEVFGDTEFYQIDTDSE